MYVQGKGERCLGVGMSVITVEGVWRRPSGEYWREVRSKVDQ
jgi:hypothetical protein